MWPLDRLVPYERNARTHSPEQIAQIAASIQEFGFTNPILVDGADGILAGHGRLAAAKDMGLAEVPVIVLDHLSAEQRRAYILADNQLALNAGWDTELLRMELGDLQLADFDLSLIGFSDEELADLLPEVEQLPPEDADADAVPEAPEEPITKPGDVWLLGKHRVMCGDSTDVLAVEKLMDGQKVDMVFTDPPYGMGIDTDYSKMSGNEGCGRKYDAGAVDNFTPDMVHAVLSLNSKEVFMWGADYYSEYIPQKNEGAWLVWDKRESGETGNNVDQRFGSMFEMCWSKVKHKREIVRYMWAGMMKQSDIDKGRWHPTQKPANLAAWFIEKFSAVGDSVSDLFGGSGTTLIACEKTFRYCRMMELDPRYCDVIVKRWQQFTGKTATLEATGEPFPVVP
jgi:DNA modification methylase